MMLRYSENDLVARDPKNIVILIVGTPKKVPRISTYALQGLRIQLGVSVSPQVDDPGWKPDT